MAKKFVRGITDVKTINNQDFDTNNVNDLLSDGQYNYIHRKKGKNEEYHNLTDNIKTLSSDNTELLAVTNYNKTTNTATLHPKHDKQKEQVLESTRNTVTINHGTNGTAEKTTVDTNPAKVLEHENLLTDYGIGKTTIGNTTKLELKYTGVADGFDLNNLKRGKVKCSHFVNAPKDNTFYFVSASRDGDNIIQEATELLTTNNDKYVRTRVNSEWGAWRQQVGDKSVIDALLAQKQDTLLAGDGLAIENNEIKIKPKNVETLPANNGFYNGSFMENEWGFPYTSISLNIDTNKFIQLAFRESVNVTGVITGKYRFIVDNVPSAWREMTLDSVAINSLLAQKQDKLSSNGSIGVLPDNGLRPLYLSKREYHVAGSFLRTYVKLVSANTNIDEAEEEYHFILKINKGSQDVTFTLQAGDKTKFNNIISAYGTGNAVRINGCLFTLSVTTSETTLTVTTDGNTASDNVITFSDII